MWKAIAPIVAASFFVLAIIVFLMTEGGKTKKIERIAGNSS